MSARVIKLFPSQSRHQPSMRMNFLSSRKPHRLVENDSVRAGDAEKRLWREINSCDRGTAGNAASLARKRWFALADYLRARTIIEKNKPGNNPAELFDEYSRVADELYKCEYLMDFVRRHGARLETGRYDGKIFVPEISFIRKGEMLNGCTREVENKEDALQALIEYLNVYISPERSRRTKLASSEQVFACEIITSAKIRWGGLKLFTDLVLDYFGLPVAEKGATPRECKRLEWVDSLSRFPSQPLFYRKMPDGAEQFAVIRPHLQVPWGYATWEWGDQLISYVSVGGDYVGERLKPTQTMVFYHIPANPDQIAPVSTGLGGICRNQLGVPAETIRKIGSLL